MSESTIDSKIEAAPFAVAFEKLIHEFPFTYDPEFSMTICNNFFEKKSCDVCRNVLE